MGIPKACLPRVSHSASLPDLGQDLSLEHHRDLGPLTSLLLEGPDDSVFCGKGWVMGWWYKAGDAHAMDGQTQEEGPAQDSCDFGALVLILPCLPLHS